MIICSELGKGATSEAGCISSELPIYSADVRSILLLPRDNRCVYMAIVCFYVCCSDCVGIWVNVCCVAGVVEDSVLNLECLSMLYVCVGNVMNVVFSVWIVRRGAVDARVWEV